jgi:hypothetical protein
VHRADRSEKAIPSQGHLPKRPAAASEVAALGPRQARSPHSTIRCGASTSAGSSASSTVRHESSVPRRVPVEVRAPEGGVGEDLVRGDRNRGGISRLGTNERGPALPKEAGPREAAGREGASLQGSRTSPPGTGESDS